MGLSASQSRLLTLTARLSDLELKAQKIQHQKVRLSEQSTEAAKKYMDALDSQVLMYNSAEKGKVAGSVSNITDSGLYRVVDADNRYFYCSNRTTNTSQSITTVSGNNITIDSNGNISLATKNNSTTVKDGVITTVTANGTVLADGDAESTTNKNAIYVSANRNILISNGSATNLTTPESSISVTSSTCKSDISSAQVTRTFTANDKVYSYSVNDDNEIKLKNCKIKEENGIYTIETDDENTVCTIDTNKKTGKIGTDENEKDLSKSGSTISLTYAGTSEESSSGTVTMSISGSDLIIKDGDITYTLNSSKMSIKDGSTNIVTNDTMPEYTKDNNGHETIKVDNKIYVVSSDNKVYKENSTTTTITTAYVGIDTATSTADDIYDKCVAYDSTATYATGSKVEFKTCTIGTETGNAMVITNHSNGSSITALTNGFEIKEGNITTKIYKSGGKIYVEENGATYTISISDDKTKTSVYASDTKETFTVDKIPAGSWVLRSDDGTFTEVNQGNMENEEWLLEQLQAANLYIQKKNPDTGVWNDYSYVSSSLFTTEEDSSGLARAEAEYEHKMSEIQQKDKKLDLELDNIETEHGAVDKQIDSVKGIVDKNVEKSFKIFS
ncbi:hypothetical protein IJ732_06255 [bacterium]|nr:hypothetical protein [bacterium]